MKTALLIGAATAAVFSFSAPVYAASAQTAAVETVVVTGSRIPQPNLTSVSPIVSVISKEFQQKGATDVSDLLNDLPQTFVSNTGDFNNTQNPLSGPGGVTTVDLRGLGAERTLVLVNGRRLGVGDPNTGNPGAAPDIDQIPVPLIGHVEVLTGGASATYGSDAVAGVVNFVMKQDFEGIQVDAQYGGYWHNNTNSYARGIEAGVAAKGLVGRRSRLRATASSTAVTPTHLSLSAPTLPTAGATSPPISCIATPIRCNKGLATFRNVRSISLTTRIPRSHPRRRASVRATRTSFSQSSMRTNRNSRLLVAKLYRGPNHFRFPPRRSTPTSSRACRVWTTATMAASLPITT